MIWGLLAAFIAGCICGYLRGYTDDNGRINAVVDKLTADHRDAIRRQWAGSKTLYMTENDEEHEWEVKHPFTVHSN